MKTPYMVIAKNALVKWNQVPSEEVAEQYVNEKSFNELEGMIGASML